MYPGTTRKKGKKGQKGKKIRKVKKGPKAARPWTFHEDEEFDEDLGEGGIMRFG